MMGIIFNFLINFLEAKSDKETVEEMKKKAGLEGKEFKAEKIYPEEEWQNLLNAACEILGVDKEIAEKMFAENVISALINKFGSYFRISDSAFSLLRKIPKIHLDLPASMGVITEEKLKIVADEENKIIFHYKSPNNLCILMKTLIEQVFKHYNETGYSIVENQCVKQGADHCEIVITTK